ncbi:MAG: hypothetical protein IJP07_06050 [Firmicutes bacterium]|nr:hypothetical protein [Bacillota bacterium]
MILIISPELFCCQAKAKPLHEQGIVFFEKMKTAAFLEKAAAKTLLFGADTRNEEHEPNLKFFGYLSHKFASSELEER